MMDISVLPNNNHPEKFLQLDVGMLPATYGMFQVGTLMSSQNPYSPGRNYWHPWNFPENTPFLPEIVAITNSNIKRNPLYTDIKSMDAVNNEKSKPSWTVKEYDTQTIHGNLADYLKKTPKDLEFWTEDLYTPGFDSLLKRKEAEHKRKRLKILSLVILSVSDLIVLSTIGT
uniref:Membrane integral NOTCH2 associated receptor 2 n=1 Tax=Acanthochromis polyacanthus TaxID=80966 RepID=A0A3Q1EQD4_9TELE